MRTVFALVFLVGVALAGLAVYVVQGTIGSYQNELARQRASMPQVVETLSVYVAAKQLKYGQVLDPKEDVKLVDWPKASLPEAVFAKDALENPLFAENQGPRTVLRVIEAGEPILAVKVTEPGQQAGLTALLEPGMRAFTVKVDRATGMAGFLRPGDAVDVYWTGVIGQIKDADSADDYDGSLSRLIHRNLKVIAIDQNSDVDEVTNDIPKTITVTAGPQTVADLALAQSTGLLSLSLVGAKDSSVASAKDVDKRTLLGLDRTAPTEPKAKVCTVRTRKGAEVVEIPIPCRKDG